MKLAKDSPYNPKIDNFIELENNNIDNFLMSSIEDEEIIGKIQPIGVIQLYNKLYTLHFSISYCQHR